MKSQIDISQIRNQIQRLLRLLIKGDLHLWKNYMT